MCSVDLDRADVWREAPRVARKPRRCASCSCRIAVGDAYLAHFSVFEREPNCESMCFVCWLAREEFVRHHGQSCTPGYLPDLLWECAEDKRWRKWSRLIFVRAKAALDMPRQPKANVRGEGTE